MLLGFYVLFLSFFFHFKKQKKAGWPKFCNIIVLFLLKIGSVGPVDQQINLVWLYMPVRSNRIKKILEATFEFVLRKERCDETQLKY